MEKRRIVVAKGASEEREGLFLPHARKGDRIELARDLADALKTCLESPCDRLYISLFSVDPTELTSLAIFRAMKPSQHVILVVDPKIRTIVESLELADECLTFEN